MTRPAATLAVVIALFVGVAADADARPAGRYPAPFERAFIASCTQGRPELKPMCRCALTWLERRYTYRRLVSVYRNDYARFMRIAVAAVTACRR